MTMTFLVAPFLAALALPAPALPHAASTVYTQSGVSLRDGARLVDARLLSRASLGEARQATAQHKRNWVQRHPAMTGAIIGFAAGFLIGYLPGDDAVFYDFTAEFNGGVLGGIGAGAGAVIGWAIGRD